MFADVMWPWVCSNSNVVVIGWKKWNKKILSCLSVYDLEALKEVNSDPGFHLLYTLQFQFDIDSFVMDDTRIALSGKDDKYNQSVTVLNFANLNFAGRKSSDLKRNPGHVFDSH